MSKFWASGLWSHISALQKEMKDKVRPLEEQLKTEQDKKTKTEIKRRIKEIKKDFAEKEKQSNYSLFNRH